MLKKRKTRELAMQIMFLWDSAAQRDNDTAREYASNNTEDPDIRAAALQMAESAWDQRQAIDQRVEKIAPQWPPRRQPGVDRNLIRLAVWELTNTATPPKVVIDEAIELSREFSTEQSPAFVNGVLDAVLKENVALTAERGTTA
jgi:N utilization substance protein B